MSTPFLRFFIFVFLLRKTSLPSRRISYQLFQTVEFDYSTCPKFLSTNIYIKYRLFLQVRAKNLEAPTLALPGLLVAKRRKRDLNPRAAWTTYTLSRGASSATWVLLQMPKYKMICVVTHSWRMVYYTKTLHSCQPIFSIFLFFSYYYRKYALQNPNQPPE